MENINVLIKDFFAYIKSQNEFLYSMLQEGITAVKIDELIKDLDIKLPTEVYHLFAYKNGIREDIETQIGKVLMLDNGILMPFEKCIVEYKFCSDKPLFFKKLPIFDDGGGGFLFIDCDENSKTYKRILIASVPLLILEPTVIYDSLDTLLTTVLRCFEEKIYYYDEDGFLAVDDENLFPFCSRLNPSSEFWIE